MRCRHVCHRERRKPSAAGTSDAVRVAREAVARGPFAVAHNEEFVPRGAYDACRISPGDRVDIVHPTAGG
ncbi:MAG: sulfur carrier protein ThiS [Candidatus Acidiferrum sp.]